MNNIEDWTDQEVAEAYYNAVERKRSELVAYYAAEAHRRGMIL